MKKIIKAAASCSLILMLFLLVTGCDKTDDSINGGTSSIKVSMTDGPGAYDAVNIEVIGLKIKNSLNEDDSNWTTVANVTPQIYNLLDLTGGITTLLASDQIPSGYLGQIRLILGENNTVVKDGVTYPLNTPSAQQSGLKLKLDQTLLPNITYNFLIDFDVAHSIVEAGNSGNYNLHPVLRVTSEATSGFITGTVPAGTPVLASVVVAGTTVSAYSDANGVFYLHGIPAGTYTVTLTPDAITGLPFRTIDNVVVVNAQGSDVGTISW